jgi:hypothetical protein
LWNLESRFSTNPLEAVAPQAGFVGFDAEVLIEHLTDAFVPRLKFGYGDTFFRWKGRWSGLIVFRYALVQ